MSKYNRTIDFIRDLYNSKEFIPLHEPRFWGNEEAYVLEAIRSTFVSSVGKFVDRFEAMMCEITGAKYAVATTNGTCALHIALLMAGVKRDDLVITQPLTFVATCNGISYTGASPLFVDVDRDTMGMSPEALKRFLAEHAEKKADGCYHKSTGRKISACVPMHTFGFPARIAEIADVCNEWNISLVEDAAESILASADGRHTGTFGKLGVFSFNGNKIVTAGGGGALVTDDEALAKRAKHITTTAKVPHPWEYFHDETGYNYRMPNLNAALVCAQLEQLEGFVSAKRAQAEAYKAFFDKESIRFVTEAENTKANYWLMTVILDSEDDRNAFLTETNQSKVMTRPIWKLMHRLPMYENAVHGDLPHAEWLEQRVVNIPSSVIRK